MKVGLSSVDITPPLGVELCGYGYYLQRRATAVNDLLFAKGLAFESDGRKILIISCDLIGFSDEFSGAIKQEISKMTGIDVTAIMIACTHTHTGPATREIRACGQMSSEYMDSLFSKTVQAGCNAVAELKEVDKITYGESEVSAIAYNRVLGEKGPLDPTVRTLYIYRKGNAPLAVVNYACHPVANGAGSQISGDYAGHVVRAMKEEGYDCIFITGFSGDIDPVDARNYSSAQKHGYNIARSVLNDEASAHELTGTELQRAVRSVRLSLDICSVSELLNELSTAKNRLEDNLQDKMALTTVSWTVATLVKLMDPSFTSYVDNYIQGFAVGTVVFLAFPGEVFTALGLKVRERYPEFNLITVNTANGVVGYIPTADEFDRKGYASHHSARLYNEFTFVKGFGELLADEAIKMLGEFL